MHAKKTCPDDRTLAAYIEGTLPAKELAAVEHHLQGHRECRDIVAALQKDSKMRDSTHGEKVPEALIQKAIRLYPGRRDVLDLVISAASDALNVVSAALDVSLKTPAPAMAMRTTQPRGAAMIVMTKEFEAITAKVAIEKVSRSLCTIAVMVADRATQTPMKDLRIELLSGGRELGSSLVEQGKVLFEEIKPGRYDIVIRNRGTLCGSITIKIQK